MKKYLISILIIYLAVILDRSVFSLWGFGLGQFRSPQLLPILTFFIFRRNFGPLWIWLVFIYYIFWEMLGGGRFPGFVPFINILLLGGIQNLSRFVSRDTFWSSLLIFVAVSGLFYFSENLSRASFTGFLNQSLVNLIFYFVSYPFLYLIFRWLSPDAHRQLSLKI